jgi:hypothetical protein
MNYETRFLVLISKGLGASFYFGKRAKRMRSDGYSLT